MSDLQGRNILNLGEDEKGTDFKGSAGKPLAAQELSATSDPLPSPKTILAIARETLALQVLKNYGADTECGACMEMAFTGATTNQHTCRLEADALARETLQAERDELQASFDAFDAGQEASIEGKPRETNPYPPGDSYGVGHLWLMWDDGYDCNINRKLKAQLAAAEQARTTLQAELVDWQKPTFAVSELREGEDNQGILESTDIYLALGPHGHGVSLLVNVTAMGSASYCFLRDGQIQKSGAIEPTVEAEDEDIRQRLTDVQAERDHWEAFAVDRQNAYVLKESAAHDLQKQVGLLAAELEKDKADLARVDKGTLADRQDLPRRPNGDK